MKHELTEKRDAITQVIYDPSGEQSGEYYPANSTHFFGKPIRRRVTKAVLKPPQAVEGARLSPKLSFVDSKGDSNSVTKFQVIENQQDTDSAKIAPSSWGRPKVYQSAAERQRAYRNRKVANLEPEV